MGNSSRIFPTNAQWITVPAGVWERIRLEMKKKPEINSGMKVILEGESS